MTSPLAVQNRYDAPYRIVRYADLKPCLNAFIDTRTPGSDKKENFTIIGPGVSENPDQHVHIAEPHGFNIGGARQPPKCVNSQHSHDTVEVFYVHSGTWRFMTGERGEDGEVVLHPGDLISIPTQTFRGFENIGEDVGFLWAVLGGDDPGRVLWAPYVFKMAEEYGLQLLADGSLIDLAAGENIPDGRAKMPVTTREQVDALTRADSNTLERCVIRANATSVAGPLSDAPGVTERLLVGPQPIDWPHGFTVCELRLAAGASIPDYALEDADVWFVQDGTISIASEGEHTNCGPGDTITFRRGAPRGAAASTTPATIVAVRGGDASPRALGA